MKTSKVAEIGFKNESGIQPVDNRVLVSVIKTEKVTKGGIVLPAGTTKAEDLAHIKARLVANGYQSFEDIKSVDHHPKPGAIIMMARHAGTLAMGKDGKRYRLVNDKDVVAVLDGDWDIRLK